MFTHTKSSILSKYDSSEVDFNQLVPRYFVHKKFLENVYLTSIKQIDKTEFICGAIIPQLKQQFPHTTIQPAENILLLSEIGRQVGLACAHHLGVSFNFAFVLKQLIAELIPQSLSLLRGCMINEIKIHAIVNIDVDKLSKTSVPITTQFDFFYQDKLIFQGSNEGQVMSDERYKRLRDIGRRKQFPPQAKLPSLPNQVNWQMQQEQRRIRPLNSSVLKVNRSTTKTISKATLIVNQQNLFFFDHYYDHVPGILINQGFNELACRHCSDKNTQYIMRAALDFSKFAELNYPVKLSVDSCHKVNHLDHIIDLKALQNNHLLAAGTLLVSNLETRI